MVVYILVISIFFVTNLVTDFQVEDFYLNIHVTSLSCTIYFGYYLHVVYGCIITYILLELSMHNILSFDNHLKENDIDNLSPAQR